jgi:DNA-binding XRE family transcriptional regulator
MIAGSSRKIPDADIWEDYYICLHDAYNSLREAFAESGLTQDELATRLGVDKSLISKRLNGTENLTLKTISQMGTGMGYRAMVSYEPYASIGMSNYYTPTPLHTAGTMMTMSSAATSTSASTTSSTTFSVSVMTPRLKDGSKT